ncbi:MAG: hypothetical protein DDT32_01448 [Syntrophomonadaceae bacterium]|nr:hypothetical protein [Bacillota bacterium]MBT9147683.1 hypothetical protein [Bacillota bacterium]
MGDAKLRSLVKQAYEEGGRIFRLAPTWVPRSFLMPGRRLKLATKDLYKLGANRGGIDERWLTSVTNADNGPGTPPDEGLSYIVLDNKKIASLKDAIEIEGELILGKETIERYGGWKILTKFFDNLGPIPHHLHQDDEHAKLVGREGKPEAYYFPPQLNHIENNFPHTYFGLEPGTTKDDIKHCLERWNEGNNRILDYSKAYRLRPGTGWFIPPGILHAPGSLVTYEVQWASDVFAMFQSMVEDRPVSWDLLIKDVPEDKQRDLDYIISMIDWLKNIDEHFKDNHYLEPVPVEDTKSEGYQEMWIIYGAGDIFSAKELTVFPGKDVTIKDSGAYGLIVVQGYGKVGNIPVESPTMIKYGELTNDELFVSTEAASAGVRVINSGHENLVMLKHFGPGTNPESPEIGAYKQ